MNNVQPTVKLQPDFRALFESAPGLYLVLSPDLRIVAVSDEYLRATMTRRDDILGQGLFDVLPDNPDDPAATGVRNLRDSLGRVLKHGRSDAMAVQKYDIRRPQSEGGGFEERYWSPLNSPVFDAAGQLTYLIHRVADVTEFIRLKAQRAEQSIVNQRLRSEAELMEMEIYTRAQEVQEANRMLRAANDALALRERELESSEARFRSVAQSASDAIIVADSRGGIVSWNRGAEVMFGYAKPEIEGQPLAAILPPRYREGVVPFHDVGRLKPASRMLDLFGLRKGGEEFPIELSLSTWETEEGTFVAGIIRDVTERRRAEEERHRFNAQLLQGQKLQAIGQLAAGIAHEINNPISYVLSNATMLEKYFGDLALLLSASDQAIDRLAAGGDAQTIRRELDAIRAEIEAEFLLEDFRAALQESREGAGRIREIVARLREFSHPDEKKMVQVDLNDVVDKALKVCGNELRFKADVHREKGADLQVLCHPQRLEQVFVNLLLNAVQALNPRGRIDVSTRREGSHAVAAVRDSGMGIAPENFGRVFEPFFTTKPAGKGTGLGLHVAYKIVVAHGGRIEFTSEPGRGTEFTVLIPLSDPGRSKHE